MAFIPPKVSYRGRTFWICIILVSGVVSFTFRDHIFPEMVPSSHRDAEVVSAQLRPVETPAPLPPEPKAGTVEVHSTPSGAIVFLEGKEVGVTPFSMENMPQGSHSLSLKKSCYRSVKQKFFLGETPVSLNLPLELVCGDLQVTSHPKGAMVWVNGKKRGVTPYTMTGVAIGELQLALQHGRARKTRTVRIQAGQVSTEPFDFARPLHPAHRAQWQDAVTGMEFVWVKGGCFAMGNPDSDRLLKEIEERKKHRVSAFFKSVFTAVTDSGEEEEVREFDIDEAPVHEVCLDGIWVGKTEVTNSQYMQFSKASGVNPEWLRDGNEYNVETGENEYYKTLGGASLSAGEHPVVGVSWHDVKQFATWFSSKTGFVARLPREAEWEYICRSGGKDEAFAGGSEVDAFGWYAENSDDGSHGVALLQANGLGLFDLSGNVWEWTEDNYHAEAYASHAHFNPLNKVGGGEEARQVVRGGSWRSKQSSLRCTERFGLPAEDTNVFLGFRIVMTGENDEKK